MTALQQMDPGGTERRVAPRMRILKRAKLIFNGGFSIFDCVVRNLSATGALLTIDETANLPKEFQIRIGDDQNGRPAKLVYRRGPLAGIRFRDIPEDMVDGDADAPSEKASTFAPQHPPSHDAGATHRGDAGVIRRMEPEILPSAVTRLFAWS